MRKSGKITAQSAAVAERTYQLFRALLTKKQEYASRLFAWLLVFQWIAVVVIAFWVSAWTWSGTVSSIHIHVWSALVFGSIITSLPLYLTHTHPGAEITRHVMAVAQMLMGSLLIHITGGRIESHFHIFGSLAFLALYKDARVIATATIAVVADHALRGIFLPQSIYGISSPQIWRTVEHGLWVVFEDVILLASCKQSQQTTRDLAARQIELEELNSNVESLVRDRTRELERSEDALRASEAHYRNLFEHDVLTGLPNRALFEKELGEDLAAASEGRRCSSVILINLNRFKQLNDTLGHRVGDALLREVAQRLQPLFGPQDTFARMGGDEFGIRLTEGNPSAAEAKAQDVLQCFAKPFVTERHEIDITASLGISSYPESGQTSAELISHASIAMNQSKKLGSNRCVRFESGMLADLLKRASLEKHIKTALANKEFELHYQPQVSLQRGHGCAISGVEALLRWNSPALGSVSPAEFIPVAEEGGEIVSIGEWVLSEACKQSVRWTRAGLPSLSIAVNVSAVQFSRPGFVHSVETILRETGMDPRLLELELTETSVMQNLLHSIQQIKLLRDSGIKIAIDDFGSGYCSLNYLQKLAADTLKIDQLFVRGPSAETPGGRGILQAIVTMARSLNLHVVGEGVETEDQLFVLEESGCDLAQGYLLSKPLTSAGLEQLLVSNGTSASLMSLARALNRRTMPTPAERTEPVAIL